MLDLPTDAGGEGPPPLLLGPDGKPFMLIMGFVLDALDKGGDARLPRPVGRLGEPWSGLNLLAGHSDPPTETGDNGALRPATLMVSEGKREGGDDGAKSCKHSQQSQTALSGRRDENQRADGEWSVAAGVLDIQRHAAVWCVWESAGS